MTFAIPRAVAEEVLPPVRSLHGLVLGADRAQPLIDHVRALAPHLLGLPVTSGPALVRAFLHMLALVLDRPAVPEVEGETRAVLGLALRRRAEMLLEQHFHDPAFGVQELAGLLGLSRSALGCSNGRRRRGLHPRPAAAAAARRVGRSRRSSPRCGKGLCLRFRGSGPVHSRLPARLRDDTRGVSRRNAGRRDANPALKRVIGSTWSRKARKRIRTRSSSISWAANTPKASPSASRWMPTPRCGC